MNPGASHGRFAWLLGVIALPLVGIALGAAALPLASLTSLFGCGVTVVGLILAVSSILILLRGGYGPFLQTLIQGPRTRPGDLTETSASSRQQAPSLRYQRGPADPGPGSARSRGRPTRNDFYDDDDAGLPPRRPPAPRGQPRSSRQRGRR